MYYVDFVAEGLWDFATTTFGKVFKYFFLLGFISILLLSFLSPCFIKSYISCLVKTKRLCCPGSRSTGYTQASQNVPV